MAKLNVGCGNNKIRGYINIDTEESCAPDLVHNLLEAPLPFADGSQDEIVFFHCIEHVRKCYHESILREFWRVLEPGGRLYISYPNFKECALNWINNKDANRSFWEATIYGLQRYETDYHVALMDPDELSELLLKIGFDHIGHIPELNELFNSITFARKSGRGALNHEQVIKKFTERLEVEV
jgi:SAM-dependent methyltransferase